VTDVIPEQPRTPGSRPPSFTSPIATLEAYRPDLAALLGDREEPPYRFAQVYEFMSRHPGEAFDSATALSKDLRTALDSLGSCSLRTTRRTDAPDGTTKLLLTARDEESVETVIMRYPRRTTVCISTQVGCSLGCTFCVTGAIGFHRNLSAAEIVDQVRAAQSLLAEEGRTVSNVVFMGMGEPLLNQEALFASLRLLKDPAGLGLAQRSLSVSTVGIPEGILRLAREEPQVNLALSLHSADDALRTLIVPANRRYPLKEVMRATEEHFRVTHRKLFVEYVLLGATNDSEKHAQKLADLLRHRVVAVNLIPCNPGCGGYQAPTPEAERAFLAVLASRGVEATIREPRGRSIDAACGQLAAGAPRRRPIQPGRGRSHPGRTREGR
jgi:23S rRNA (adenine2503-C2)-methyltransferase